MRKTMKNEENFDFLFGFLINLSMYDTFTSDICQLNLDIFTEWTQIDWLTDALCKVDFKKDVNLSLSLSLDYCMVYWNIRWFSWNIGRHPTKWWCRRRGQSIMCGWRRKSCYPRSLSLLCSVLFFWPLKNEIFAHFTWFWMKLSWDLVHIAESLLLFL